AGAKLVRAPIGAVGPRGCDGGGEAAVGVARPRPDMTLVEVSVDVDEGRQHDAAAEMQDRRGIRTRARRTGRPYRGDASVRDEQGGLGEAVLVRHEALGLGEAGREARSFDAVAVKAWREPRDPLNHSITRSAATRSSCGIVNPSSAAVLALIT